MKMTNDLSNKKNINFQGIKQEKIIAEKFLKKCNDVIPYTKSNSYIAAKINQHYGDKKYQDLIDKLFNLYEDYNKAISKNRQELRSHRLFNNFKELTDYLKNTIIKTKFANCAEKNYVLQSMFLKENISANAVRMFTKTKKTGEIVHGKDHTFLVLNLSPYAQLDAPTTWGNKAIVVDAWSNIVMKADEAIRYFEKIFSNNLQKEKVIFESANKIKIPKSSKIC